MKFTSLIFSAQCALISSLSTSTTSRGKFLLQRPHEHITVHTSTTSTRLLSTSKSAAADDALDQTKKQYDKISKSTTMSEFAQDGDVLYKQFVMKPANALKEELKSLKLQTKGRKPDLARRLVEYYMEKQESGDEHERDVDVNVDVNEGQDGDGYEEEEEMVPVVPQWQRSDDSNLNLEDVKPIKKFAKLPVSKTAGMALARARFGTPTPIQESALPLLSKDEESLILHAETGSGKTLCYLLPITERLWREVDNARMLNGEISGETSYALIITPTRELAAQVAGVATCLAPPGSVRLVTNPTNLVRDSYELREKSHGEHGGRLDNIIDETTSTKIIVGSAKSIYLSLFGDSKLHPPTSKPEAKAFLSNVSYLALDEIGE